MTFGPTHHDPDAPVTGPTAPGTLAGDVDPGPVPIAGPEPSRRQQRLQRRAEIWEARRNGPPPPRRLHRAVVLVLMMAIALFLVWLIAFHSAP